MNKIILFSIMTLSFSINAGSISNAKVTNVRIDQNGKGIVTFDKNVYGGASCVTASYLASLSFDTNTVGGQGLYASALAAKLNDNYVSAISSGTCGIFNGNYVEDAKHLWIL